MLIKKLIVALVGLTCTAAVLADDVKIGIVSGFTGPLAKTTMEGVNMARGYIAMVNDQGGINGNKIVLATRDDSYDPKKTPGMVEEIIEQDNVAMLVNSVGTGNTVALIKSGVLAKHGMPLLGVFSGSDAIRGPGSENIFHTRASYHDEIMKIASVVSTLGLKKVAVLYQDDGLGVSVNDSITKAAAEYKFDPFLRVPYKPGETNFAAQAEAYYNQHGLSSVPDAKTPEEAKAKIREEFLRQAEGRLAVQQARQFVTKLYAMEPVAGSNLVTLAQSSGLAVHTTAPFTEEEGPAEFAASADLVKFAFKLNPDLPYSRALPCGDALYVIGLAKQLPSAIQPFNQIYSRVSEDYRYYEGALKARAAATNFYYSSVVQMATGKSFAQVAVAAGLAPVALPPFSLSSQAIPEVEGHVQLGQIKNAAFSTSPGHISPVEATQEGAFMLYVQTLLPVDEATKTANLPQFLTQIRRNRQNEAFDRWLTLEENRELANTPVAEEIKNEKSASRSE